MIERGYSDNGTLTRNRRIQFAMRTEQHKWEIYSIITILQHLKSSNMNNYIRHRESCAYYNSLSLSLSLSLYIYIYIYIYNLGLDPSLFKLLRDKDN